MLDTMKKNKHGNVIENDWEKIIIFIRWSGKASVER